MDDDFLVRAEALLLEAAVDPALWQPALDFIAGSSSSTGIVVFSLADRGPPLWASASLDEASRVYVRDGWHLRDHRYTAVPLLEARGIVSDQDFVSPDEMKRMPYYQEFLRPQGLAWSTSLKIEADDQIWSFNVQRGSAAGAYEVDEQRMLLRLGQIMSRSASLARRLDFARLDSAMGALDALRGACLAIDRFGRVRSMNAAAEAMAGRRFFLRQGRLALPPPAAEALQRHIDATLAPDLPPSDPALGPVSARLPGHRPLVFRAIRLKGVGLHLFSPAHALLLVTDLDDVAAPPVERIRTAFRLTQGETRLAEALMQRFSLVEAAQQLGISHETARSRIKALFAKTETRNQVELTALLSRLRDLGAT